MESAKIKERKMSNNNTKSDFQILVSKCIGKKIKEARLDYEVLVDYFDKETQMVLKKPIKKLCTQTKLAKNIGVTFQQVQKYEKGKNLVSTDKLLLICAFFKKPLAYFLHEAIELMRQDTSLTNNPIAPSLNEFGDNTSSKCH